MDSQPNQPQPQPQPQPFKSKLKSSLFYVSSIFILLLAISFAFNKTQQHHKPYTFPFLQFLHPSKISFQQTRKNPGNCVLWMAPFLSGGGYSSEAWSYILSLHENQNIYKPFKIAIQQHGDLLSFEFWEGLPNRMRELAGDLHRTKCQMNETIVVCHSEPGAWSPPLFETLPCPPPGGDYESFRAVIGRTMFETDRLSPEHVRRCNRMDYVWVPTEFHVATFVDSGVDPSKVVKIVQPIDVRFFDPVAYEPLKLSSIGELVLGKKTPGSKFVFLSIFKWEYRKGWDVLLKSYLEEFTAADKVALYLSTNPYHSDKNFSNKIVEFVQISGIVKPAAGWSPVYVIDTHIAQSDLPRIYKAADAFVLPSRGEGWGRPLVEAMAMSLPVIATNWSGPTEYLTDENSYPLIVDRMSELTEGPFKGHLWAEPSVTDLRALMRHVIDNVDEAKAKGRRAREDMIAKFSPQIVADIVVENVRNIFEKMERG